MLLYVVAIDGEVLAAYSELAVAKERVEKAVIDEGAVPAGYVQDGNKYVLTDARSTKPLATIYELELDSD